MFRVVWKKSDKSCVKYTVYYATKDQAEHMAESIVKSGFIVIKIERKN